MKKKIQIAVLLLLFSLCLTHAPVTALADPDPQTGEEGGENGGQEEMLSSDNSLISLKIAQASLSPEFSPEQLTYTATVPYDVTRIALTAQTSDPEATKVIAGTGDLQVGDNIVTVVVTAQDGSVREYRITVIREESEGMETPAESTEITGSPAESSESEGQWVPGESDPPAESDTEQAAESGAEPDTEQTAESGAEPIQTVENERQTTSASQNQEGGFLSGRSPLLLILCIACLIVLFAIVAVLLLRRGSDDGDEDEEYEEDEYLETETDSFRPDQESSLYDDPDQEDSDSQDEGTAVTLKELARFYQALNADAESGKKKDETMDSENAGDTDDDDLELVDFDEEDGEDEEADSLDEDFELLEEDDDFDFLDF